MTDFQNRYKKKLIPFVETTIKEIVLFYCHQRQTNGNVTLLFDIIISIQYFPKSLRKHLQISETSGFSSPHGRVDAKTVIIRDLLMPYS